MRKDFLQYRLLGEKNAGSPPGPTGVMNEDLGDNLASILQL
jgi:hypothetical protein